MARKQERLAVRKHQSSSAQRSCRLTLEAFQGPGTRHGLVFIHVFSLNGSILGYKHVHTSKNTEALFASCVPVSMSLQNAGDAHNTSSRCKVPTFCTTNLSGTHLRSQSLAIFHNLAQNIEADCLYMVNIQIKLVGIINHKKMSMGEKVGTLKFVD